MTMTTKKKFATAALAGLLTASLVSANPSFAQEEGKSGDTGKMEKSYSKTADGKEKHACKGKNSCKGQGADGKNACKGKGSCRTDGSQPGAE